MTEEKLHYKIHISGRVQGVGYRWNAAYEARLRNIKGYVRNMPDGGVYIEAEGSRDQLENYLGWCRRGPGMSNVKDVKVEQSVLVDYSDFVIEH